MSVLEFERMVNGLHQGGAKASREATKGWRAKASRAWRKVFGGNPVLYPQPQWMEWIWAGRYPTGRKAMHGRQV